MKKNRKIFIMSIVVFGAYVLMVTVNALANILPINGIGTGEISDLYANLFAPAGLTFAIWGVIYLLLFGYSVYQFIYREKLFNNDVYRWIGFWFAFSSVINTVWIFAWHYDAIGLSLLLMVFILISLIKINMQLRHVKSTSKETLFIKIPFTVYFGWITVATIANVTTFLVSIEWNRFGISEVIWTNVVILIGAIIGFIGIIYYRSVAYGLVIVWAYLGIYIKHTSPEFFNNRYPSVIVSVIVSIAIVIVAGVLMLSFKSKKEGVNYG